MSGPKPIASLGPLLLARKGTAKPAMRAAAAALHSDNDLHPDNDLAASQAELGWNDMGDMPVVSADPVVRRQREELVTRLDQHRQRKHMPQRRREAGHEARSGRSAFTLRLDAERRLKLKLASAVEGASAQQLVTKALDRFLAEMPELESLASQIRRDGKPT